MIFLGLFIIAGGILLGGLLHGFTVPWHEGLRVAQKLKSREFRGGPDIRPRPSALDLAALWNGFAGTLHGKRLP